MKKHTYIHTGQSDSSLRQFPFIEKGRNRTKNQKCSRIRLKPIVSFGFIWKWRPRLVPPLLSSAIFSGDAAIRFYLNSSVLFARWANHSEKCLAVGLCAAVFLLFFLCFLFFLFFWFCGRRDAGPRNSIVRHLTDAGRAAFVYGMESQQRRAKKRRGPTPPPPPNNNNKKKNIRVRRPSPTPEETLRTQK